MTKTEPTLHGGATEIGALEQSRHCVSLLGWVGGHGRDAEGPGGRREDFPMFHTARGDDG